MASTESLIRALQIFNQGIKDYKQVSLIDKFNSEIKDIDPAGRYSDEAKDQIKADKAKELQMRLASIGADANVINTIGTQYTPKTNVYSKIHSLQDLIVQANVTGDPKLVKATTEATKSYLELERQKEKVNNDGVILRAKELAKLGITPSGKPTESPDKLKTMPTVINNKLNEFGADITQMDNIINKITNNPKLTGANAAVQEGKLGIPLVGSWLADSEYQVFKQDLDRWFDTYRTRVTGAAAGDKELERLMTRLPKTINLSGNFQKQMQEIKDVTLAVQARMLVNQNKLKYDTSGFSQEILAGQEAANRLGISLTPGVNSPYTEENIKKNDPNIQKTENRKKNFIKFK